MEEHEILLKFYSFHDTTADWNVTVTACFKLQFPNA